MNCAPETLAPAAEGGQHRQLFPRLFYALILLLLCGLAVGLGLHPRRGLDFRVYLVAAERFWTGLPLYLESDGAMPFKYPPAAPFLFSPFLLLPARAATALWNLLSVGALALMGRWLLRFTGGRYGPLCIAAVCLAQPLYLELQYGQVDLAMALLLFGAALWAEEGKAGFAGAALAMACLFKPPALLFLGWFAARRQGRVIAWFALASCALWIPLLVRYGPSGGASLVEEWMKLVDRTTQPWAMGSNPQGIPTLLLSLFYARDANVSGGALALSQVAAMALFGCALAWARPANSAASSLLLLGVALASPLAWRANFVLAFPALAIAAASPEKKGLWPCALVFAVGVAVQPALLGDAAFREAMFHRPFAWAFLSLTVWGLFVFRARERARG